MVGASANPARPSHAVLKYLSERGFAALPINPALAGGAILGLPVYASLADAPGPIDMVDVFRKSEAAGAVGVAVAEASELLFSRSSSTSWPGISADKVCFVLPVSPVHRFWSV